MNVQVRRTNIKAINSFYVIDFDRCLGNVDASFDLLSDVVEDLLEVDVEKIRVAYKESEAVGISFSVLDYVKKSYSTADLDLIKKLYLERAILVGDGLLEPGAVKLVNFLLSRHLSFCIMSFGEEGWQNLKISATRLSSVPRLIVPSRAKGSYIARWQDSLSQKYIIPKECFLDNEPRIAQEVILIDDKISAFKGLPSGARGYLVVASTSQTNLGSNAFPHIEQVSRIDQIINLEAKRT